MSALTCGVWLLQEGDDPAAMLQPVGAQEAASHRLVVEPRVPPTAPHGCPLCPANLCKVRPMPALACSVCTTQAMYAYWLSQILRKDALLACVHIQR